VLALLREGLTNQQIGDRLGISRAGAAYHVSEILSKMGVNSREEAARMEPDLARRKVWGLAALGGLFSRTGAPALKVSGVAILAGTSGALALVAIGAGIMALRDDGQRVPSVPCVSGEDARNPIGANGEEVPVLGLPFDTLEEGEAFICLNVPQLPEVDGWFVSGVNAVRSNSLDRFDAGEFVTADSGYRFLGIGYLNPDLEGLITFDFTVYPKDYLSRLGFESLGTDSTESCVRNRFPPIERLRLLEETDLSIDNTQAIAQVYEDSEQGGPSRQLFVCWQKDDLVFSAYARYGPPLDYRRDVIPFLELVEW
jgi:hypothetical protein